ncbi:MAG TPA: right-handed parallel beta-helix repeat-containing protein [Candidatus Eisenbacteria bacterium]|nr:right-handed parallel beta-helix repeat-containing protein [Candidatus Eisenbacteria bacterium]
MGGRVFVGILLLLASIVARKAAAATTCGFDVVARTMLLQADCTTDATIGVPDGFTLDGRGHTITALDPPVDHYRGAILQNAAGATRVNVRNVVLTASGIADVCDTGDDKLRGIALLDCGGMVSNVRIVGLKQTSPTACSEGSGIIVNTAPFDGTHPATKVVKISNVRVSDFQFVGLQAQGDVSVRIEANTVEGTNEPGIPAAGQFGMLLGRGAITTVRGNVVRQDASTTNLNTLGIFAFEVNDNVIDQNRIEGAPAGVFVESYCQNTPSANRNRISANTIRVTNEGIILVARDAIGISTCDAHVDQNLVAQNTIKAIPGGGTAPDGVFVGAQDFGGPFVPTADANTIKRNTITGFGVGIFQNGDTNTVIQGNVVQP